MLPREHAIHDLADVGQEVEAVSDLDRVRRSLPGTISVAASTVPADDLHSRVISQPGCKNFGRATW